MSTDKLFGIGFIGFTIIYGALCVVFVGIALLVHLDPPWLRLLMLVIAVLLGRTAFYSYQFAKEIFKL